MSYNFKEDMPYYEEGDDRCSRRRSKSREGYEAESKSSSKRRMAQTKTIFFDLMFFSGYFLTVKGYDLNSHLLLWVTAFTFTRTMN